MNSVFIRTQLLLSAFIFCHVSAQITEPIQNIVDEVNACYKADKSKWDNCLVKYINDLRPHLAVGVPEMQIPQLDPTVIDEATFPPDSALLQGKAILDNLRIDGLGGFNVTSVSTNVAKQTVTAKVYYPSLHVDGHYAFDGNMLVLPVKGDGKVTLDFKNSLADLGLTVERDGAGIRLSKVTIDFESEKIVFQLDNLLGGAEVGTAINNLINDNSQEMIKELKPVLTTKLAETVIKVLAVPVSLLPAEPFIQP